MTPKMKNPAKVLGAYAFDEYPVVLIIKWM